MSQLHWRRSSRCTNDTCPEVARTTDAVHVRDSKDPHGLVLRFTIEEWDTFVAAVRAGEFDEREVGAA